MKPDSMISHHYEPSKARRVNPCVLARLAGMAGTAVAASALLTAGCGKSDSSGTPAAQPSQPGESAPANAAPPAVGNATATAPNAAPGNPNEPVDLTHLKDAFATAKPFLKLGVEDTIELVHARDFASAADKFESLSKRPDINADQRQALNEVVAKLRSLAGQ